MAHHRRMAELQCAACSMQMMQSSHHYAQALPKKTTEFNGISRRYYLLLSRGLSSADLGLGVKWSPC